MTIIENILDLIINALIASILTYGAGTKNLTAFFAVMILIKIRQDQVKIKEEQEKIFNAIHAVNGKQLKNLDL